MLSFPSPVKKVEGEGKEAPKETPALSNSKEEAEEEKKGH